MANTDLNRATNAEKLHKLAKYFSGTVAAVILPGAGGDIAAQIFDLVVTDPAARRRDELLMDLASRTAALEAEGRLTFQEIQNNDEVSALWAKAAQVAVRSSGKRKLAGIREAAIKGTISAAAKQNSPAQIMIALLDRMTEHHMVVLAWENGDRRLYTIGQIDDENNDEAHRSLFYGQAVTKVKETLSAPVCIHRGRSFCLYVEETEQAAFSLARADLIVLGLMEPVFGKERHLEGRRVTFRTTPDIAGYQVSQLGKALCKYISVEPSGQV